MMVLAGAGGGNGGGVLPSEKVKPVAMALVV